MEIYKVYLLSRIFPVYVKCNGYIQSEESLDFYGEDEYDEVASFDLCKIAGFKKIK